jgi:hypothetical protein
MLSYPFAAIQFATSNPAVDESAVTNEPHAISTTTTVQLQSLSIDIEVSSKVA